MSALSDAAEQLRSIESDLLTWGAAEPTDSIVLAERVRQVRLLLDGDGDAWIGTTQAKRALGLRSESTVKAWARHGRLRSRALPNGRLQVLLEDILTICRERNGLGGRIGRA